jgi:hypothetical protein
MIDDIRATISDNFQIIMPVLFIVMILFGEAVLLIQQVLPGWNTHETLSQQILDGEIAISNIQVEQIEGEEAVILQSQIDRETNQLTENANVYLTPIQADGILDLLYVYAGASAVEITNLQAQQPVQEASSPAYDVRMYRFEVTGPAFNLITFIMRFKEASAPAATVSELLISPSSDDRDVMSATLMLYVSPLASGDALGHLPELSIPTAMVPTPLPSATPEPTMTITPTPGDGASLAVPDTVLLAADTRAEAMVSIDANVPTPPASCPNAPPSLFQAGDSAIVDFNSPGALRMITEAAGNADQTIAQLYDNQQIELLEGPVCAQVGSSQIFYWYARRGQYQGWVAEASPTIRWLCPVDNPECA